MPGTWIVAPSRTKYLFSFTIPLHSKEAIPMFTTNILLGNVMKLQSPSRTHLPADYCTRVRTISSIAELISSGAGSCCLCRAGREGNCVDDSGGGGGGAGWGKSIFAEMTVSNSVNWVPAFGGREGQGRNRKKCTI